MLYLLPGMGADQNMYKAWDTIQGAKFINWSTYNGEKSFAQIAKKIIKENDITSKDQIGGSSFGGIISIEIDKILNNERIILIGSAIHIEEINPVLISLSKLLYILPLSFIQAIAGKMNILAFQMFSQANTEFIKFSSNHLKNWSGFAGDEEKIIRIHGNKDWIIDHKESKNIIEGAGHLIAMTHPSECEKILSSIFAEQKIQPI